MSEEKQNEEIVVEDVQEENLVENQELVQDKPEEVTEESQENLTDSVLDVLLGEAKKKTEAEEEEEEDEDESTEDESEEDASTEDESEEDESTEDDSEEDESEEDEETPEEGVKTKAGILADAFSTIKSMKKHDLVNAYESMRQDGEDEMEEDAHEKPSTKADMINAMYKEMKGMKKDDLMAAYDAIKDSMHGDEEEKEVEEAFATDLKVLADAESNLTEDFKTKASTLFEAAVANKVATIKEGLENTFEESLQEEIVYIRDTLVGKIDNYLTYVVEDWMSENQEYVDNKLRTEIAEDFMQNLKNLFVESYIEVPESKVDLVDSLAEDVESSKAETIAITEERDALASQIIELQREKIVTEATSELTSTQSAKFDKLLEDVEFIDASNFKSKVQIIKEAFFSEKESVETLEEEISSSDETEIIVEGEIDSNAKMSSTMERYTSSLSRIQQNSHK